jgi:hypothetical protein
VEAVYSFRGMDIQKHVAFVITIILFSQPKKVTFFLELTFFLDEESNKEIKAICQPEFFLAHSPPYYSLEKFIFSTSWLLASQIPAPNRHCHRTIRDVN